MRKPYELASVNEEMAARWTTQMKAKSQKQSRHPQTLLKCLSLSKSILNGDPGR
jgi:hypothetical protein